LGLGRRFIAFRFVEIHRSKLLSMREYRIKISSGKFANLFWQVTS
jgi:hypothetical protein